MLEGIRIDYEITAEELKGLRGWLNDYRQYHGIHPFDEVVELLDDVLADGKIDEAEHSELLEWADWFLSHNTPAAREVDAAVMRLHGVLAGVAVDGKVTEQEIADLQEWLHDYGDLRRCFPFDHAIDLVDRVLADGVVTDAEKDDVLAFCNEFAENKVEGVPDPDPDHTQKSGSKVIVQTIDIVCVQDPRVEILDRRFCFTGKSKFGKRALLHELVVELGGHASAGIAGRVDYLVIGDLSSPHWTFSTYGRKVENALDRCIPIIREEDFMQAADRRRRSLRG